VGNPQQARLTEPWLQLRDNAQKDIRGIRVIRGANLCSFGSIRG